jgi:hypothetical protein
MGIMAEAPKRDSTVAKVRALRARFRAVHAEGLAALQRQDYSALADAINIEQDILNEHGALILEQRSALIEQHGRLTADPVHQHAATRRPR